jgi:hypothetical protein
MAARWLLVLPRVSNVTKGDRDHPDDVDFDEVIVKPWK